MKKKRYPKQWIALSVAAILSSSGAEAASLIKPVVGVYYTSWAYWHNGPGVKHVDELDQKPASFISYAFFAPKTSTDAASNPGYGGAPIGPEWADQANGTIGDMDDAYESDVASKNYSDLMLYKSENPQTLLIASIGGWAYGPRFHQFAVDANYDARSAVAQNFLNSCEQLLRGTLHLQNKTPYPAFDGIDIDWEFPGFGQQQKVIYPQEFAFYSDLMQQLRKRVDRVNKDLHTNKVLTVAVPIQLAKLNGDGHLDWGRLGKYFDLSNVMGFDAHGEFDAKGEDKAAMDQAPADELLAAINSLKQQGVDSQKIVLGLPTYAREMLVYSMPSQANNYTYGKKGGGGEMYPDKIGLSIYYPDTTFSDPPNSDAYLRDPLIFCFLNNTESPRI